MSRFEPSPVALKLTPDQRAFVEAMLTHRSIRQAAMAANVPAATATRWMRRPAVVAALRDARRQVVGEALMALQLATGEAVETLRDQLTTSKPSVVRVMAARAILDTAIKITLAEDLGERVAQLEAQLETRLAAPASPSQPVTSTDAAPDTSPLGISPGISSFASRFDFAAMASAIALPAGDEDALEELDAPADPADPQTQTPQSTQAAREPSPAQTQAERLSQQLAETRARLAALQAEERRKAEAQREAEKRAERARMERSNPYTEKVF